MEESKVIDTLEMYQGVATDYDWIGLKPDQREIESLSITHQIAVVKEQCDDSSSILRTNCV